MNLETKREQEKRTVSQMTQLYCRGIHGGEALCQSCSALLDYACQRIDNCPFVETKTSCVSCKVHCYKPQMREQICTVMRYAGPRMMFFHPVAAIRHLMEIKNEKSNETGTQNILCFSELRFAMSLIEVFSYLCCAKQGSVALWIFVCFSSESEGYFSALTLFPH